jgi:hypothetical protein
MTRRNAAKEWTVVHQMRSSALTLALLFCERVQRTVRECAVQLRNYRYTPRPEDRMVWAAMHEANETEILIDWNPEDPEFALALTMDGRVLGWLEAEPLLRFAPNDPATQSQIAESMSIRRGLEKATKQTLKAIAATARANGAQTAEDALYGRLQLPTIAGTVISHRMPRVRPEDEPRNILPGQGSKRLAERLLRNNPNLPEEKGSSVGAVISQRMPRLRPDKTAVAPMSAADIAARLLRDFGLEKVG